MIRYAFKTSTWRPTELEWLRAANTISDTEQTRISQFMFKRDAKQSMAGRLLMRTCFTNLSDQPAQTFRLDRDPSGKPYLVDPPSPLDSLSFNVSHAGDYAVLVGSCAAEVGVDVMKVELRRRTTIQQFFSNMTRQFTQHEWKNIYRPATEEEQLFNFYRHWCLKESFVKTVGTGLKFGLKRIEFDIGEMEGQQCFTTNVAVDGSAVKEWRFEEIYHDNHIIATAIKLRPDSKDYKSSSLLEVMGFKDLFVNQAGLEDTSYFILFDAKKEVPG